MRMQGVGESHSIDECLVTSRGHKLLASAEMDENDGTGEVLDKAEMPKEAKSK